MVATYDPKIGFHKLSFPWKMFFKLGYYCWLAAEEAFVVEVVPAAAAEIKREVRSSQRRRN